jgi:hypothetical protein
MTNDEMDELDKKAIDRYMLWDDVGFASFTEGPRHRRALQAKILNKKSTGLIREEHLARFLGLKHNTRMHSTTDGITTFDAVDESNQDCYEIKAEEYTTNNPDRKIQSGQLTGTGVFSNITSQDHIDRLRKNDPMIAHGMFGDGRLLCVVRFRLSHSKALDRISKYALGETATEPRYALSDWIDCPTLEIVYVSENWPAHMAPKCRATMLKRWRAQQEESILENTSSPKKRSSRSSKIDPTQQTPILCNSVNDWFGTQDSPGTLPTSLFDLSL